MMNSKERLAGALYGRSKGKTLRPAQASLMRYLLPRLALDLSSPSPRRLAELFPCEISETWMEIGFGGGEHMAALAERHASVGLIGCEPFVNGVAKALMTIEERALGNIRLHEGDAGDVLDWLPQASLARIYLLYPDPWPKTRHHKRRFVSPANLSRLSRVLQSGGELRFASDWADYADWTLRRVLAHPDFAWEAAKAEDWRLPWDSWPGTRYEEKAVREGRRPVYFTFRRR